MAVTFEQEHRHAEKITMTFQIRLAIRRKVWQVSLDKVA